MPTAPQTYTTVSRDVEAILWTSGATDAIAVIEWIRADGATASYYGGAQGLEYITIGLTDSSGMARPGDYIVKISPGVFVALSGDEFATQYTLA